LRKSWPLSSYYDFVQRHQLPEEQKYHEMMLEMQSKLDKALVQTNKDLSERAQQLETSYKALVKTQKEIHSAEMEKLRKNQEKSAFSIKQQKNEELAKRLASETANVESSLIRFMENQNRLDQICSIAAQMDPKSLAKIFDELPDDKLIYDIMGGLEPSQSGKILGAMDSEKASKVMRIGNLPIALPDPTSRPSFVPPGLQSLLDETRLNTQ
jgi:flagellar motility protein MotE (MotC chaperone)